MNYLRLSTVTMLVVGIIAIAGGIAEFGPLAILLGMMMILSAIIKLVALRIMDSGARVPGGARQDD